jgi:hypothetical protein
MKLICKNYGLINNTEVENEDGRVLITNGLDIKTLVDLWRWYYNIPFWEMIELEVDEKLYNATQLKSGNVYSVKSLFSMQNVMLVKG